MNDDIPYIPGYRRPRDGRTVLFSMFTSAVVSAATTVAVLRWGPPVLRRGLDPAPATAAALGEAGAVQTPNVVALSVTEANQLLAQQGLRLMIAARKDSPQPADTVLEQQPLYGSPMVAGGAVSVVVSSGQRGMVAPDLTGHSLDEARSALEVLGFVVGTITEVPDAPAGQVIAQNPSSGSPVVAGGSVALSVGAQAQVTVPDLVGVSLSQAKHQLESLGVQIGTVSERYDRRRRAYVVLEQDPAADSQVAQGAEVNLVINEGD